MFKSFPTKKMNLFQTYSNRNLLFRNSCHNVYQYKYGNKVINYFMRIN